MALYQFLNQLSEHNNRAWFQEHKEDYEKAKAEAEGIFQKVYDQIATLDDLDKLKTFRIYRDVRFSKNKSPYKTNFGCNIPRRQPHNRGSFYIHIEPGQNFVGVGFWMPEKDDLLRIRQAIAYEDELEQILSDGNLKKHFGELLGDGLKTAPKGFDKEHPRMEWIKKKQFYFSKQYSDEEILSENFAKDMAKKYQFLLPFFKYMTEVLTTDANGESII